VPAICFGVRRCSRRIGVSIRSRCPARRRHRRTVRPRSRSRSHRSAGIARSLPPQGQGSAHNRWRAPDSCTDLIIEPPLRASGVLLAAKPKRYPPHRPLPRLRPPRSEKSREESLSDRPSLPESNGPRGLTFSIERRDGGAPALAGCHPGAKWSNGGSNPPRVLNSRRFTSTRVRMTLREVT
jgi:hypothetical protein